MALKTAESTAVTSILNSAEAAMALKTEGERYVGCEAGRKLGDDLLDVVRAAIAAYDFTDVQAGE